MQRNLFCWFYWIFSSSFFSWGEKGEGMCIVCAIFSECLFINNLPSSLNSLILQNWSDDCTGKQFHWLTMIHVYIRLSSKHPDRFYISTKSDIKTWLANKTNWFNVLTNNIINEKASFIWNVYQYNTCVNNKMTTLFFFTKQKF